MKKLFMALWGGGHPFNALPFDEEVVVRNPEELDSDGLLVIWGGADISPSIYNKPVSKRTWAGEELSTRDKQEVALAKRAIELKIPIMGVCRGAQLLCALAGGHLIQHVNRHGGTHRVVTNDGKEFVTNSIHHQMMYPFDVEHVIKAYMPKQLSDVHIDVDSEGKDINVQMPCEPEYVYFPQIRGHAVQWHPEGLSSDSDANKYVLDQLRKEIFA